MRSTAPPDWNSFHIYYYGDQDAFLVNAVRPALNAQTAAGLVHRHFFLRYWKGGPHLRLRVHVAGPEQDGVEESLRRELEGYMRTHPGEIPADRDVMLERQAELARLENEGGTDVVLQDCIRKEPYRPELAKYGGEVGVRIAEKLFCESSTIVLDVLGEEMLRPARRLGTGFVATLVALRAAGMSPNEMGQFLAHYCRLWSAWVIPEFKTMWPRRLHEHRRDLARRATAILGGCELPGSLQRWESAVGAAWSEVLVRRDAVLPEVTLAGPGATDDRRQGVLLSSFIHTHNNRLGLIPASEAFLGYLGHHVVCELLSTTPDPGVDAARQPAGTGHDPSGWN